MQTDEQARSDVDRTRLVQRVLWLTLLLNLAVALAKILYGYHASTLSIRADGFHSLTDGSNNLVGLIGVAWAALPADRGHPYGHQKIELLAAGAVGALLLFVAWDVLHGAFGRVLGAAEAPSLDAGAFVILVGTLGVNLVVAAYEAKRGKELNSSFLMSDADHTKSDVLVTLGVLASVGFIRAGLLWVDVVAALLIAILIGWVGVGILRRNFGYLADSAQLDRDQVERVACGVPGVASAHKIRTRGAPGAVYVDLHIQIAPHLNVVQAHQVTHWVIDAIKREFEGIRDVLVHTEPAKSTQRFIPLPPDMGNSPH